jgi:hypothetical protein
MGLRAGLDTEATAALGKTSIAVHHWTVKQSGVDRQSLKQEDNIYCNMFAGSIFTMEVYYTHSSIHYS